MKLFSQCPQPFHLSGYRILSAIYVFQRMLGKPWYKLQRLKVENVNLKKYCLRVHAVCVFNRHRPEHSGAATN